MLSRWANDHSGAGIPIVASVGCMSPAAPAPTVQYQSQLAGVDNSSEAIADRSPICKANISQPMFGNNIAIFGGHFTQAETVNYNPTQHDTRAEAFRLLQKHVAPSAFHNSAQRVDPPRCHPNTRTEILLIIYNWAIQYGYLRKSWVLWLNGAAGAGKSAIIQSVIEQLLAIHSIVSLASFFFSRDDHTRNIMDPLVATLVYQLIQKIPATSDDILKMISENPLIFEQSLEFQLHQLIIQPLLRVPLHMRQLFVIFIDGLDECIDLDKQVNLLRVIGKIYSGEDIPIVFIIASRRDPQIQFEFDALAVLNLLDIIPLDDSEASDDIRHFLNEKFAEIKRTHPFRHLLASHWPSVFTVTEIVDKASNQFIYASVVINYISSPRTNPARQLQIIHDLRLRNPSSMHPFAHLDSLYHHIFSQVVNIDAVLDILAFYIITGQNWIDFAFRSVYADLEVILADLTTVLQLIPDSLGYLHIKFLHASLPDFLQDELRSEKYFLDLKKYTTKLLCMFLERPLPDPLSPANNWENISKQEFWQLRAIRHLLHKPKPSLQLRNAFMNFKLTFHSMEIDNQSSNAIYCVQILKSLKRLDFGDQGPAYQHVLDLFAGGHSKFWSSYSDEVKDWVRESPDLCARICQLRPDLARRPSLDLSQEAKVFWRQRLGYI